LSQLFSKKLQAYLTHENLSIVELSNKLDVPVSTVHGWLNGVLPKNIVIIKKVANLLGKSVDELCFDETPVKKHQDTDLIISIGDKTYRISLLPENTKTEGEE
jgi:hypothetical protein